MNDGKELKQKLFMEEKVLDKTDNAFKKKKASHILNMLIAIKTRQTYINNITFIQHICLLLMSACLLLMSLIYITFNFV